MKIQWLGDAVEDLQHLRQYMVQENPKTARLIVKKIVETIALLGEQPTMGRPGRVLHTRELVISGTPYLVPYQVRNNVIEILRVFHTFRQWPENW